MHDITSSLLLLLILVFALAVMVRPLAPSFSRAVGRQLGNCLGRVLGVILGLLIVAYLAQSCFQSCVHSVVGPSSPTTSQFPEGPNLPHPPEPLQLPPSTDTSVFCPPVAECKGRPLEYAVVASTDDPKSQYSVVYLGKYDYTEGQDNRVGDGSHPGWDIRVPTGTPVLAVASGVIVFAGPKGEWGNLVVLKVAWKGRTLYFSYAHLSKVLVAPNQHVARGTVLGESGGGSETTGNSTGPHLHFQGDFIWQNNKPFCPGNIDSTDEQAETKKRTFDALKLVLTGEVQ